MPIYEEKKKVNGQTRYFIRTYVNDEFGRRKQITRHNKDWIGRNGYREAQAEENRLIHKKVVSEKVLFTDLIKTFLNKTMKFNKESTYVTYENCIDSQIKPYFQNYSCNLLEMYMFKEWHKKLDDKGLSLKYKNKCHSVMSSILEIAMQDGLISQNFEKMIGPFKLIGEEKEKVRTDEERLRYITYSQFNQLIKCIDSDKWYLFVNFLYFTGMRKGEIQALTWNEIDFNLKRIRVIKTLSRKTKNDIGYKITSTKGIENRYVDMNERLYNLILKYYNSHGNKIKQTDFIFGGEFPLAQTTIDNKLKKYFNEAGLERITPHEFRHSHVSLLISEYVKGGDTDTTKFFLIVGKRLGHTLEVMQKTYLHLFPNVQKSVVNLLDNLE